MGSFVGSIHFKNTKSKDIIPGLIQLNKIHGAKFIVEDAPGGWCSVFPNNSGQDTDLSREVMKLSTNPSLNLVVHDSDILLVDLYDGVSRFDTYNSNPGYFGEAIDPVKAQALKTFPEGLSRFALNPKDMDSLRKLFGPDGESPVVDETLRAITNRLGIPQAQFSYEYIEMGEYVSKKRVSGFIYVPGKEGEKAQEANLKEEIKTLRKEGILLFEKKGGPIGGGERFSWKTDPESEGLVVFHHTHPRKIKKLWTLGEPNVEPSDPWSLQHDLGMGLGLNWDIDKKTKTLVDRAGKVLYEFPPGINMNSPRLTPDRQTLFFGGRPGPGWLDLKTMEQGLIDSGGLLAGKGNHHWKMGPSPLIGMKGGDRILFHDWAKHRLIGYARPCFPPITEELVSKCFWHRESPERWEATDKFMLQFRQHEKRPLRRFWFGPNKEYIFISDGFFSGRFSLETLLHSKGEEVWPDYCLFFIGCPADKAIEFGNNGGCDFPLCFEPKSGLWLFGDMLGALRALEPDNGKIYRFLTMPRRLRAHNIETAAQEKALIIEGWVSREYLKNDEAIQVYNLEKVVGLKLEDFSDFIVLKSK
jgi:hypothetical protein